MSLYSIQRLHVCKCYRNYAGLESNCIEKIKKSRLQFYFDYFVRSGSLIPSNLDGSCSESEPSVTASRFDVLSKATPQYMHTAQARMLEQQGMIIYKYNKLTRN